MRTYNYMKKILFLKHAATEGPGTISNFLDENNIPYEILELWRGDSFPQNSDNLKAVVSLGGPMNVYEEDKYSFLKDEDIFIKKLLKKEIPLLGICLGAQLLAKAAGAKVYKAKKEEIGWFCVDLTDKGKSDSLFKEISNKLEVFQWHGDTFDIPKDGSHLISGDIVPNQAFRIGKNAYGFQFHIEINEEIIKLWFGDKLKQKEYLDYFFKIKENYL